MSLCKFENDIKQEDGLFYVPQLNFDYNSLEPYIDANTMEIHITKHHKKYVDNLNMYVNKYHSLISDRDAREILEYVYAIDKKSYLVGNMFKHKDNKELTKSMLFHLRANAGGHLNHSMFWEMLSDKETEVSKSLREKLINEFGSMENFKEEFIKNGLNRCGSGWIWLVAIKKDGKIKLQVITTPNQDNPIMYGYEPIICCDIWEHAYYLKYTYDRREYISQFFQVINWELANKLYERFCENNTEIK